MGLVYRAKVEGARLVVAEVQSAIMVAILPTIAAVAELREEVAAQAKAIEAAEPMIPYAVDKEKAASDAIHERRILAARHENLAASEAHLKKLLGRYRPYYLRMLAEFRSAEARLTEHERRSPSA